MSIEAPEVIYPGIDKRFTMNSEQQCRKDGGTPRNTSFVNGKAVLNGTSSDILCEEKNLGTVHSIRLRGTFSSVNSNMPVIGNDSNTTNITIYPSVGIYYKDGTSVISAITFSLDADTEYDIIITRNGQTIKGYLNGIQTGVTRTLATNNDFIFDVIGSYNSGTDYYGGTIDLLETYNRTLTDSEAYNLAHNLWNTELNLSGTLLNYNSSEGVLEDRMVGSNVGDALLNLNFDTDQTASMSYGNGTGTYNSTLKCLNLNGTGSTTYAYKSVTSLRRYNIRFRYRSDTFTGIVRAYTSAANQIYSNNFTSSWQEYNEIIISDAGGFYIQCLNNLTGTINIDNIVIQEIRADLVPTSVDIVKIGSKYSAKFNGSASKIDTGTTFSGLTGSITTMLIVKLYSWGSGGFGNLINVGDKFILYVSSAKVNLISNGSTTVSSAINSISLNTMLGIAVTRTSTGVTNFYIMPNINSPLASSGTPDQVGGTPVAGLTNYLIGNNVANSRGTNGLIPKNRTIEGILTIPQMQQWFTENLKDLR